MKQLGGISPYFKLPFKELKQNQVPYSNVFDDELQSNLGPNETYKTNDLYNEPNNEETTGYLAQPPKTTTTSETIDLPPEEPIPIVETSQEEILRPDSSEMKLDTKDIPSAYYGNQGGTPGEQIHQIPQMTNLERLRAEFNRQYNQRGTQERTDRVNSTNSNAELYGQLNHAAAMVGNIGGTPTYNTARQDAQSFQNNNTTQLNNMNASESEHNNRKLNAIKGLYNTDLVEIKRDDAAYKQKRDRELDDPKSNLSQQYRKLAKDFFKIENLSEDTPASFIIKTLPEGMRINLAQLENQFKVDSLDKTLGVKVFEGEKNRLSKENEQDTKLKQSKEVFALDQAQKAELYRLNLKQEADLAALKLKTQRQENAADRASREGINKSNNSSREGINSLNNESKKQINDDKLNSKNDTYDNKSTSKLAKEIQTNKRIGLFLDAKSKFMKVEELLISNNPISNSAGLKIFIQSLDNSVVRESEFAQSQNGQGLIEGIKAKFTSAIGGGPLSAKMKRDLIASNKVVMDSAFKELDTTRDMYMKRAIIDNADEGQIASLFDSIKPRQGSQTKPTEEQGKVFKPPGAATPAPNPSIDAEGNYIPKSKRGLPK